MLTPPMLNLTLGSHPISLFPFCCTKYCILLSLTSCHLYLLGQAAAILDGVISAQSPYSTYRSFSLWYSSSLSFRLQFAHASSSDKKIKSCNLTWILVLGQSYFAQQMFLHVSLTFQSLGSAPPIVPIFQAMIAFSTLMVNLPNITLCRICKGELAWFGWNLIGHTGWK